MKDAKGFRSRKLTKRHKIVDDTRYARIEEEGLTKVKITKNCYCIIYTIYNMIYMYNVLGNEILFHLTNMVSIGITRVILGQVNFPQIDLDEQTIFIQSTVRLTALPNKVRNGGET